jgi:hypothetical protein
MPFFIELTLSLEINTYDVYLVNVLATGYLWIYIYLTVYAKALLT